MNHPLVIAHRGASAAAPENTMAAFELALRQKADGIELDVWKCASGEVVVTHNRDTKALTGKSGDVERMSLKELRRLDFGALKAPKYRNEKIPTLKEVLDLARGLEIINIEIKGVNIRSRGIELDVAEAILQFKLLRRVIVSSFNPTILLRLQSLNPAIRIGLLLYEKSPLPLRQGWTARFLNPYSIHPSCALLQKKLVERAHRRKQRVIAWTINDFSQFETCIRHGVDAMITDDPAWMLEALKDKEFKV
ncbi:MAG TPA: glycerophosphodiester phosphodiesterase [Deltaproteobacteria bacterium]|nr:glycerophosphodiester phosphodiesterase [Deltaproteobacteria bacterium]